MYADSLGHSVGQKHERIMNAHFGHPFRARMRGGEGLDRGAAGRGPRFGWPWPAAVFVITDTERRPISGSAGLVERSQAVDVLPLVLIHTAYSDRSPAR